MVISQSVEQFELFSEIVDRVMNSRFVKWFMKHQKISVKWDGRKKGLEVTKNWPDEDLVNRFLLPFRMFVMGNVRVSWRKMGELYETLEGLEPFDSDFLEARRNLDDYLDFDTIHTFDTAPRTKRELMHVFFVWVFSH